MAACNSVHSARNPLRANFLERVRQLRFLSLCTHRRVARPARRAFCCRWPRRARALRWRVGSGPPPAPAACPAPARGAVVAAHAPAGGARPRQGCRPASVQAASRPRPGAGSLCRMSAPSHGNRLAVAWGSRCVPLLCALCVPLLASAAFLLGGAAARGRGPASSAAAVAPVLPGCRPWRVGCVGGHFSSELPRYSCVYAWP